MTKEGTLQESPLEDISTPLCPFHDTDIFCWVSGIALDKYSTLFHPNRYLRKRKDERWKRFFLIKCFKIPNFNRKDLEQHVKHAPCILFT